MATISTLQCVNGLSNTGIEACSFDPKNIKGGFFCYPGYVIPAAAFANGGLLQQLKNDCMNDSKALRIFPFGNFADMKDNSEKPVEEKLGYGDVGTVRDGIYDLQYRFRIGGLLQSNKYRTYNRAGSYYIFVDANNAILGTVGVDSTGAASIAAIPPIEFYQDVMVLHDGKKNAEYWAKFRMDPKYINELIAYSVDVEFDILSSILGLQNVMLSGVAGGTSGVYQLTALTGAAKINMATLFPTALASASLWTAVNATTGAVITISSVALGTGANAGTFTLTLTTTAPPYPTTGKINFNLVGPTELATALIPGYESTGLVAITHN